MSGSPGLGLGRSPGFGWPGFQRISEMYPQHAREDQGQGQGQGPHGMQEWVNTTAAGAGPGGQGLSREDQVSFRHFLSYV